MTKADQKREDDVLRRMLNTPPTPHKVKTIASEKVTRPANERVTPADD